MVPAWSGSGESPLWFAAVCHPWSPHMVENRNRKEALSCLFIYGYYSHSWGLYLHNLITSQRSHFQILLHWELAFDIQTGGRGRRVGTNIQFITGTIGSGYFQSL